jgi:hypothetical protein
MKNTRSDLLKMFQAGLDTVAGETVVKNALATGNYQ